MANLGDDAARVNIPVLTITNAVSQWLISAGGEAEAEDEAEAEAEAEVEVGGEGGVPELLQTHGPTATTAPRVRIVIKPAEVGRGGGGLL